MLGTYHLTILYEVVKNLHFLYDSEKIYSHLLENIVKALDADAASLYIADARQENLKLKACVGPKKGIIEMISEEMPFPFGEGLAGWAAKFNQALLVENVQNEPRFNPKWDTLTGYKTKSVLCAPISNKDVVLGVIEVLNKRSANFNQNDQDLVTAISKQTAIAIENGRLYTELNYAKNFTDSMISNLTGGFIAMDNNMLITHLNPQAEKVLRLFAPECLGVKASEALKNYPEVIEKLNLTFKTKEKEVRKELSCSRTDKSIITLGYSTFPILDKSQKTLGAGIIFQDLTALHK